MSIKKMFNRHWIWTKLAGQRTILSVSVGIALLFTVQGLVASSFAETPTATPTQMVMTATPIPIGAQATEIATATPTAVPTSTPVGSSTPGQPSQPASDATQTPTPTSTTAFTATPSAAPTQTVAGTLTPVSTVVTTVTPPAGDTPTATVTATPTTTPTPGPSATPTSVVGRSIRMSVDPGAATVAWGSSITYNIVVTNTGVTTDTIVFDKSDSNPQQFTSVFSATTIVGPRGTPAIGPLAPGASGSLSLTVSPKSGVWAGVNNVTYLNAVLGSTNEITSLFVVTTVGATYGVSISASPGAASAPPGSIITCTVSITNSGNLTDAITLGTGNSNPDYFTASFDGSNLHPMPPGGSESIPVTIAILPRAIAGTVNLSTITAISSGGTSVTAHTVVSTTVTPVYKVDAAISPQSALVEPGQSTTFSVAITNTGNVTDTARISYGNSNPKDFDVSSTQNQVDLNPGANSIVPILVSPKVGSAKDATTTLSVQVSGKNGELPPVNLSANATVTLTHKLEMTVSPNTAITPFRTPVTYTVLITNAGNAIDDVELSSSQEITKFVSQLDPPQIKNLSPGESRSVKLVVKPERPVTKEFGKRISGQVDMSKSTNNTFAVNGVTVDAGDIELFRVVSTPFDGTKITASAGMVTTTEVVTTTVMPPQVKLPAGGGSGNGKKDTSPSVPLKTVNKIYRPEKEPNDFGSFLKAVLNNIGDQVTSLWQEMPWNHNEASYLGQIDTVHDLPKPSFVSTQNEPVAGTSVADKIVLGSADTLDYGHKAVWNYTGADSLGPHKKDPTTCGFCHEVHGAAQGDGSGSSNLLIESTTRAQCDSCHDGTGSKYRTEWGAIDPQNGGPAPTLGGATKQVTETSSSAIGFGYTYSTYTAISSTVDFVSSNAVQNSVVVSATQSMKSAHKIEQLQTPTYSTGVARDTLLCSSCHDPHGVDANSDNTYNYRQFRQTITFGGLNQIVYFTANLNVSAPPTETVSYQTGTVSACTSCHNNISALNHGAWGHNGFYGGHMASNPDTYPIYMTDGNPAAGDVWTYFKSQSYGRIPTERNAGNRDNEPGYPNRYLVCLSCHTSHGTQPQAGSVFPLRRPEFEYYETAVDALGNPLYLNGWCGACHLAT